MQTKSRKEEKFKKRLLKVLGGEDLHQQKDLVDRLTAELNISMADCAAALVFISQPNLYQSEKKAVFPKDESIDLEIPLTVPKNKSVRYRLDVGSKHQVNPEDLIKVLVDESGVDRKRIGRLDIRHHYSIVELPDGMPPDIFQLLTEVEIQKQKLNIKRLKAQRKFRRFRKQVET